MGYKKLGWLLFPLFVISCSVTKHIPEDQSLITGYEVSLENPELVNKPKKLKTTLNTIPKLVPSYGLGNSSLWIYYKSDSGKEKGLRSWIQRKFGKPPVYYQPKQIENNRIILENRLHNIGYFGATVKVDSTFSGKKVEFDYRILSKGQYQIRNIHYPIDSSRLSTYIQQLKKDRILKSNSYYSKANIDLEKIRLYKKLGENGYWELPENTIHFYVDTLVGNKKADIFIDINQPQDTTSFHPFYIGNRIIFPAYTLDNNLNTIAQDTIKNKQFTLIQNRRILKSRAFRRIIAQEKGELANKVLQNTAIKKLTDLGVFKFINVRYEKTYRGDSIILNQKYLLTPALSQDIIGEFQLNNRTGSFFGTSASITYTHRNLLKGAERFDATLSSGVETQFNSNTNFINTLEFNADLSLSVPYFIFPFKLDKADNFEASRTAIKITNNLQQRTEFFTINALSTSFGYTWKQNQFINHAFDPIRINWVSLLDKTETFEAILDEDPRLRTSFENTFILGLEYTFTLNTQQLDLIKPYLFFRNKISTSGNVIGLFTKQPSANESSKTIFGVPYAQFFKIVPEIRFYIPRKENLIATRFVIGLGIPYGNSKELPYSEQFFVGGSNSIRAFRLRQLGPGSFFNNNPEAEDQFIDQTGDLKLEFNIEYRFPIFGYLKGAVFLDAGNVWLLESETRPEGVFQFNKFFKQIAVGTGLGFRLDFEFFVIRLDSAFPLRQPTAEGTFEWTFSDFKFHKKSWRRENIMWNLAIGYPF